MENVKDIDGNSYKTVKIGEQIWMAENLKVNRYRNGDKIPTGYTRKDWYELKTGAYTFNDDNPANFGIYGNLYNWYAVDDHRGLSPEGWHIPTDDEWRKLEQYLGMKIEIMPWFRGSDEGSKLAGNQDLWEN